MKFAFLLLVGVAKALQVEKVDVSRLKCIFDTFQVLQNHISQAPHVFHVVTLLAFLAAVILARLTFWSVKETANLPMPSQTVPRQLEEVAAAPRRIAPVRRRPAPLNPEQVEEDDSERPCPQQAGLLPQNAKEWMTANCRGLKPRDLLYCSVRDRRLDRLGQEWTRVWLAADEAVEGWLPTLFIRFI
eukprot:symbB.v1.2.031671.t1/scaffold3702.1/size55254/2